jgi:outer membrane protein TolC
MNAAAAKIRLAQTAFLPRVDGLAQVNRATRNTYYGMLFPNAVIPSVDGAPVNNLGSVWDSGAGLLVTWQPFDFGLRHANVAAARADREYAQSAVALTRFDVAIATADAYLTMMAAQETASAAQAAVSSWETLLRSIHALVSANLRPGADESRIQSELAIARTQLAQAQQAVAVAQSTVSEFVGVPASKIKIQPGKAFEQIPPDTSPGLKVETNPLSVQQNAQIAEAESRLKALQKTYRPQFLIEASASARGTGFDKVNGTRLGGGNGLAPTTQNYGVGLTVNFPFMDLAGIRAQEAAQSATVRAEQARQHVIATTIQAQWDAAQATLAGARAVALNTPTEVSSAHTAVDQASARYRAGLASIDNLAQAQRLLSQAEMDDALARLNVWRALLQLETAAGDIQPFVSQASQ